MVKKQRQQCKCMYLEWSEIELDDTKKLTINDKVNCESVTLQINSILYYITPWKR